jgi:hypothetical protein
MKNVSLRGRDLAVVAGLLLAFTAGQPLLASDPTGIYALVDKVALEPNVQSPERIQIWGVFILSKEKSRNEYESPARGYLYFSLPTEKPELVKTQWADLHKIAGTGQCVAFGSRYQLDQARPKVRGKQDKPETPDRYPLGIGLTKLRDDYYQVKPLKSLPASRP